MVENASVLEKEEHPKLNKKAMMNDIFYGVVKSIGGAALKFGANLTIEGEEHVPLMGKAILTTISKNAMQDMLVISQLTGRKIHFMLSPKIMKHQVAGPLLKSLGAFRSTLNKDDNEPIEKVFEYLNEKGDLVAMTPEAKMDREKQVKTMASIIKFAAGVPAPIIPLAVVSEPTKLFNLIPSKGIKVKVGAPIPVEKSMNRDKNRDKRYELAEGIVKIIESLKSSQEKKTDEKKTETK